FLNQSSLKRLGLLDPTTCVGLRYGQQMLNLEDFLGSLELLTSNVKLRHRVSALKENGFAYFPSLRTYTGISNSRLSYPTASLHRTHLLGPTNPGKIIFTQETLVLRRTKRSPTDASKTHPTSELLRFL
ncbi:hypothetical protein ADUPG1_003008, partial [Aduncisulcus paluster]